MSTLVRAPNWVKSNIPYTLALTIDGTAYGVRPIDPGEDGTKAFRLAKHSRDECVYDLIRTHAGLVECDCPSYEMTHRGSAGLCKHGRALVALGLLDAPAPGPAPPPDIPDVTRVRDEFDGAAPATTGPCCAADESVPCSSCDGPGAITADPPRPSGLTLSLAGLVEQQARAYRAWGNQAGDLIAERLGEMVEQIHATSAATPEQFRSRLDVLLHRVDRD